ncbi:ATP-binding cassette domain-containing protein [Peribacillus frigoritolerans]|uniref:ABC transporter ATP-binding protein n=1 Tax=Peribacillus TaxID=2675229 RepID=UPI002E206388|nr:ATP-binding cassette domain-containing protein [Peribacillus frigoritolerans]MED3994623.1 ATP-binding cassette domain-containing protein [Peribacillus frigoritolerans]
MLRKAIECAGITKKFGDFKALDTINLDINAGEIFGLLGPNGSGKTTLINSITGLSQPTEGNTYIYGIDSVINTNKARELIGMVPQETAIYMKLTGYENLAFHADYYNVSNKAKEQRIKEVLDIVQLYDRRHDRAGNYSGGMKRRLLLARAMLTDPKIIIMDEPTLGVDVQARNAIWNQILELKMQGKTILLTTNVMEEAEYLCDRLAIIDHGKLVEMDTPSQLKNKVGEGIIELEVSSHQHPLTEYFKQFKSVKKVENKNPQYILTLFNEKKEDIIPNIFSVINENNLKILKISMREPSLNDVFLHFTGRKLRD